MKQLHMLAYSLVVVGALNWGFIAFFNFNLVGTVFGAGTLWERVVYGLVGLGGIYLVATHWEDCKTCRMIMKKGK